MSFNKKNMTEEDIKIKLIEKEEKEGGCASISAQPHFFILLDLFLFRNKMDFAPLFHIVNYWNKTFV